MDTDISIQGYREIVSENPYKEMWNQLYYFTDVGSVNRDIRERFKLVKGEHKTDTEKQAHQIAYSIMQADNYFKAAQEVDLSVKPNLIYYGMASLANTVIIYNNDGTFSLDYLRDKKKEKHHGLEDKFSLKKVGSTEEILGGISCDIYRKPGGEDKGKPYGHFKNFYGSIVPECIFFDRRTIPKQTKTPVPVPKLGYTMTMINIDKRGISDLSKTDLNLLTILKFLPDTIEQLANNEIKSNLYPGDIKQNVYTTEQNKGSKMDAENQKPYGITDIYIDRVSEIAEEYFRDLYSQDKAILLKEKHVHNLHFSHDSRKESDVHYSPDMTQDLSGRIYFIYQVEKYIQELAIFYICFFCTGMLCRYYPDYWMRWLEKNVGFRHLMDRLCSVAIRKFPNLILNQLTRQINHFHL